MSRFKHWLREYLGINEIWRKQENMNSIALAISERLGDTQQNIKTISSKIGILNQGLGRVIAKLDANYARSEFDPAKQAESDAIGEEVLRRLAAEQAVRDQYGYTPKSE